MANVFYLDCERAFGTERVYHSPCPLWCSDHERTEQFSIDFADFTHSSNFVRETDTVTDSLGNVWGFRNGTDDTYDVADKGNSPPSPNAVYFLTSQNSHGEQLILEPIADSLGNRFPHPPRFNRGYPWSVLLEGVSGLRGTIKFVARANNAYSDPAQPKSCGHTTEISAIGELTESHMRFLLDLSNPCSPDLQGIPDPAIAVSNGTLETAVCVLYRINPCGHVYDKIVRITHDNTFDSSGEVYYWLGTPGSQVGNDPVEKAFGISCTDWWVTDPVDPDSRGSYQPDMLAENPVAIYPPNLIGAYNHDQSMQIRFSGAVMEFFLRKITVYDSFLSDSAFNSGCPPVVR